MSYQTLEQRFLARSTEIYNKFSNTSATNPEIKPDSRASRSRIKDDNRSLPTVSTQRDTSRIFNFLKSRDGVLFLSKQLLLQTGNTFAETRLFNPLEIQINSAPFVHAVRHLGKPIGNFTTPTRDARGALQQETVNSFAVKTGGVFTQYIQSRANQLLNAALAPFKALSTTPNLTEDKQYYIRPEDGRTWFPRLVIPQALSQRGSRWEFKDYFGGDSGDSQILLARGGNNTATPQNATNTLPIYNDRLLPKINIFPRLVKVDKVSGPSKLNTYINSITQKNNAFVLDLKRSKFVKTKTKSQATLPIGNAPNYNELEIASAYTEGTDSYKVNTPQGPITIYGALSNYSTQKTNQTITGQFFYNLEAKSNGKTLVQDETGNGYFDGPLFSRKLGNTNGENISTIAGKEVSKIKDAYNGLTQILPNSLTSRTEDLKNNLVLYDTILGPKENKSDIIKFIFKSTELDAKPIHFRAFISSIKETTKPEYSEQRYIGRTERFVTYAGVKRTVNLEFNIVALSANEIDNMWLRINYLTGLAFPKGASPSGFMIPPLFKVTIGGIYEDQPCYVDSLDYDFLDDKITFDIDSEVSQVINVRLSLTLLEKRSKFYNSPFYKVVEELQKRQLKSVPTTEAVETETVAATTTEATQLSVTSADGTSNPAPAILPPVSFKLPDARSYASQERPPADVMKQMPTVVSNRMTDRVDLGPNTMRRPISSVPASAQLQLPSITELPTPALPETPPSTFEQYEQYLIRNRQVYEMLNPIIVRGQPNQNPLQLASPFGRAKGI